MRLTQSCINVSHINLLTTVLILLFSSMILADARGILNPLQNYGIGSARYCSGFDAGMFSGDKRCYDIPSGMCVVRWNIDKRTQIWKKQLHRSLIGCHMINECHTLCLTAAFDGEMSLWDTNYNLLESVQLPHTMDIRSGVWKRDGTKICVAGVGYGSAVICYDVIKNKLKLNWSTCPPDVEPGKSGDYVNSLSMCEFSDVSDEVLVVEERQKCNDVIYRLDAMGDIIQSQELVVGCKNIKHTAALYLGSAVNGYVVLGVDRGWVLVINTSNLVMKALEVKHTIRSFLMDGDQMVFSTADESLLWWTMDGVQVREIKGAPVEQALKMSWGCEGNTIWLAGPSFLSLVQVDKGSNSCQLIGQIERYQITCVGLSHNSASGELVAGDITGKVAVWGEATSPTHQCQLSNPPRCIMWTQSSGILIGCLDGSIYRWDNVSWTPPSKFCILQGSVLHMRLSQSADRLAVGTSQGQLGVFTLSRLEIPSPVFLFYAHEQTAGEVWSACWSPDDQRLATASEDTSVRVWRYNTTGVPLHTFLCHSAAVTAVDWKQTTRGSVLASCSDDRTVVLHCGDTYASLHTIRTAGIYGWYTLTYMRFSPLHQSPLIACVTQNGHIVFYDVMTGTQLRSIRIHLGSVEGLDWFGLAGESRLVTLSSDCTVQYYVTHKQ